MSRLATIFVIVCMLVLPASTLAAQSAAPYFPERFDWQHKKPEEVGMDPARLDEAVKQAIATENPATKNMVLFLATTFGASEPFDTPIGPIQGSRWRERHHHASRIHRCRVGRPQARRHDL